MKVLGIESTAHTIGIGVWPDKVNVRHTYKPPAGWGIDPKEARKHHEEWGPKLIEEVLKEHKPDIIAVAAGPGLPPCLLAGMKLAKEYAKKLNVPLVGVNHCIAHLEIGRVITGAKDPVMLYVSGGNTQVVAFDAGRYRVFGETQDIALGNLIDVFARDLGLEMPGGPKIEQLAKNGKKYVPLPYSVKGMDVSFTGMLTALRKLIGKERPEDLAYSLQETAFAMVVEITERAMAHCQKDEVIVTGGVAANKRLQEMLRIMAEERKAKFYPLPLEYAGDNGLMIAYLGFLQAMEATYDYDSVDIKPKWRTDEVEVTWR